MGNKTRVSISSANFPNLLKVIVVHALGSRENIEVVEDGDRFADICIAAAEPDDADVLAEEFFKKASGGRLIVLVPDGRSALLFPTEGMRETLGEISVHELADAIENLATLDNPPSPN